jgi:hypothetical protein
MSISRTNAPTESSVCSVLSTLCPVSAECTAISADSRSRISPIRITSGSWRTMALSESTKLMPGRFATEHCEMPSITYSTGSSQVMIFLVLSFMRSTEA